MGDVVPAVSPDKETQDAIKNFGDGGDQQAVQVVYNKQSKDMENLMESLKDAKGDDRKAVEQKLQALNKAQSDLAAFMTANKIPVPASGFVDQVRSIRGWEEIFDTIHLMLGSDTICFKILQYAPLSSLPVENMKDIPPPEGVKIVELPNLPDLPDPGKLLEDVKPITTEPAPSDTTPPPTDTTPPPDSTVVDPAKPPEKPAEEIPPTSESVKKTWDDIRESIRTVLEATQKQVTTIQDVLSEVATLSKNYTTNFIPLIADEKKYGFAYKKIDLLKKPTESLNALVSVLDTQSTDHLQIVVGKGKVLLQQVGQKVLESTYKTISDCETKKQQEYASLTTVYNGYLDAMKYLSELKGQLAASQANVQFGEQTVEAYGKMKTVIQSQYDAIDSNKAKEVGDITSALQAASSKLDEQNKELNDKAQATADSIMKDVDNRRKELNDVIKGQQDDLNSIPLTRKTVKTVVKKHLWGLFSTSSNVEVDEANTMELDAQKKKIEITQDLQKQALDAGKDQLNLVMDLNKQQAALFTDKIKLLNEQALKDKSRLDSLYAEIKKELYDQIQDLTSKINATNLEVGKYTGSVTTLTAQIKDYEENAAGLKKNADQLAADMRARIQEYDKTIDSAKTQTNNILEHYGAQINSSPAVTATIELLGYLLGLPKSVTDTALSMVYFRFKVYRFVRDMQVGIEEIETGSKDIDAENDPALDVDRWQKWVASLGKGADWQAIAQRMADDGVTYSILQDLSKEDYDATLAEYGITKIKLTVFKGRIKDYQNLGSVARLQVSQGITRVFDQLKVLGAFATMINELTTAKDKGELAPSLENVDEKALVVAN